MPVTVKIEDRKKAADTVAAADLGDYIVPGERSEGIKSLVIWIVLMLALCGGLSLLPQTQNIGFGLFAWWILSSLAYFVIAPRLVLRRMRSHAAEYLITARKHPRLKTLLSKGSGLIGIDEPEGFLSEETVAHVRVLSAKQPFVIVTSGASELLLPPELDCLTLQCMVHARLGHVRRLMLLQFLGDTPPAARILAWPVALYAYLLRLNWHEMAEQSADRLTLLLVKNPKLLMSSLLKQFASSDPAMQNMDITINDVDSYIKQGGLIGNSGTEISTQYKIGSAIQDNPYLEGRIRAITAWVNAPEYVSALEKLAAQRAAKTPAATSSDAARATA